MENISKKALLPFLVLMLCILSACAGGGAAADNTGSSGGQPQSSVSGVSDTSSAETSDMQPAQAAESNATFEAGDADTSADMAADSLPDAGSDPAKEAAETPSAPAQADTSDQETGQEQDTAPEQAEAPAPYSVKTPDTILEVSGGGAENTCYFTMDDLLAIKEGYFEDDYFSRRTGPEEATNRYGGVLLSYLLENVVGIKDGAKKITVTSSDGYGSSTTISAVRASYINEKDPTKTLYMILAWNRDGEALTDSGPLQLVMGQLIEGEYNRQYWVKNVCSIEVKTP
ncbi:MAG: hypothetical protein AB7C97_05810 [Oscillospiraceae bacterium]